MALVLASGCGQYGSPKSPSWEDRQRRSRIQSALDNGCTSVDECRQAVRDALRELRMCRDDGGDCEKQRASYADYNRCRRRPA